MAERRITARGWIAGRFSYTKIKLKALFFTKR